MADKMAEFGVKPGDVHFTPEGSRVLAGRVAAAIEKALDE